MASRRALLRAALALPIACPAIARAQPAAALPLLSLIVGSVPGHGADTSARALAPFLERHLRNVRVAVLNRPGSAGLAALNLLAAADPAGQTIGWVTSPVLPARMVDADQPPLPSPPLSSPPNSPPESRGTTPDLLARLRLVAAVQAQPLLLVANPRTGPTTFAALLRRIAGDPACQPLATPQEGSPAHLAALLIQAREATRLNIVAFPSAAAARQAAESGHAAAALLSLGDVRENPALATIANPIALPTILRGLALPAAAPDARVNALAAALRNIAADPEFIAAGIESGFHPTYVPGRAWTTQMRADHTTLANLWRLTPWTPPPTLAG